MSGLPEMRSLPALCTIGPVKMDSKDYWPLLKAATSSSCSCQISKLGWLAHLMARAPEPGDDVGVRTGERRHHAQTIGRGDGTRSGARRVRGTTANQSE